MCNDHYRNICALLCLFVNIWQTFSHGYSGNKHQRETFSKHTTIICMQLQTFIECLFSVWNCLWTFVNHLLDVSLCHFECSYMHVCLTFAECSCANKQVSSNYVPDLFIICLWTNIQKQWTNVQWRINFRGGRSCHYWLML